MRRQISFLLVLLGLTCSCKKSNNSKSSADENESGQQKAGSISGKVDAPKGTEIILNATAFINGKQVSYDIGVSDSSTFKFEDITAGLYTISLPSYNTFVAVNKNVLQVYPGKNANAGIVAVVQNPDNGSIKGSIKPLGAAKTVYVQAYDLMSPLSFSASPDPSTGYFEIKNLPPARYYLWFALSELYKAPTENSVVVSPRQANDMGMISIERAPFKSKLSLNDNSGRVLLFGSLLFDGSNMIITAAYNHGMLEDAFRQSYRLTISVENMTGPGTYLCKASTNSKITYSRSLAYSFKSPMFGSWSSQIGQGDGIVTIKSFDAVTKTVEGSFKATLDSKDGKYGMLDVSDGDFSLSY